MNAVVCSEKGGAEVLKLSEGVAVPQPKDTEVLVEVAVAGVNYIDTYIRSGLYPNPAPSILGREGAGRVARVGASVTEFKEGDRVAFFAPGSYAEYAVVSAAKCMKLAAETSFAEGASVMLQGLTAHYLTRSTYPLKKGDVCLIHAAAGGTGGLMVQMAKLAGATVIATCGSAIKVAAATKLGADLVINYSEQDFLEEVKKFTDGKGVNVAYDGVGAATWEKSMLSLKPRGLLVCFGNASGKVPPIDPLLLSKNGSLFVTRPTLASYIATPEEFQLRCTELMAWVQKGQLTVRVDRVFPIAEVKASHEYFESRKAMGKILLSVSEM